MHAATLSTDSYHRIAATGGSVLGVDRVRAERGPGLPAHLAGAPVRHPGLAVDGHQRVVERRPVLRDADHPRRRPLARAPRGARQGRHRHQRAPARRAGRRLGDPRRRPGARPRRHRPPRAGQEGRRRADQERPLAGVLPAAQPLRPRGLPGPARRRAHRARRRPGGQARAPAGRRGPAGRAARRSRPPSTTCGPSMGEEAGSGHEPASCRRTSEVLDNPYQYTDYKSDQATAAATRRRRCSASRARRRARARGSSDGWAGGGRTRDRDPTSSRRWRAGSTSWPASTPTTGAMSLSEVATAAGLARPTARRLLLTLRGARLRPLGRRRSSR